MKHTDEIKEGTGMTSSPFIVYAPIVSLAGCSSAEPASSSNRQTKSIVLLHHRKVIFKIV